MASPVRSESVESATQRRHRAGSTGLMAAFFVGTLDESSDPDGGTRSTLKSLVSAARITPSRTLPQSGMQEVFRIGPLTDECRTQSHSSLAEAGRATRGVSEWHRMTADALKDCNKRHLAQMAKEKGITGWHAMRKDQLIRALSLAAFRSRRSRASNGGPRPDRRCSPTRNRARSPRLAPPARDVRPRSQHPRPGRRPSKHWTMLARKTASSF